MEYLYLNNWEDSLIHVLDTKNHVLDTKNNNIEIDTIVGGGASREFLVNPELGQLYILRPTHRIVAIMDPNMEPIKNIIKIKKEDWDCFECRFGISINQNTGYLYLYKNPTLD